VVVQASVPAGEELGAGVLVAGGVLLAAGLDGVLPVEAGPGEVTSPHAAMTSAVATMVAAKNLIDLLPPTTDMTTNHA
jgi:hypothetical protein